ncbi:DUF1036 domain-containing protein [Ancylobacter sp. 6x-1]|uniref:DUF1036 domain-containing protein n=1 Tax=Ancylobacter crimeensis TaxID=2579147 RepID=A0ABT0DE71_9HYPH|nr:DUF1036 domain-containing protein [Ancylobacter crimeensis]MCK0198270.1 DUF1036 domain-containing protein [Ancylobacter crimeensis]
MISAPYSSTSDTLPLPRRRGVPRLAALLGGAGTLLLLACAPAAADFRLCNRTDSRVGIAVGYKDGDAWATEGWWNVNANSCETLLRGDLVARYYYVYAVDYDLGGEWAGKAYMCTREKEFTIRGIQDCLARGYDRTGFFEVDTHEQRSWTVQLTEQSQPGTSTPGKVPIPPKAPERP